MPAKKSSSKQKTRRLKRKQLPWFLIFRLLIILVCLFCVWLVWLDYRVQTEFSGKRWSLPARVYAKPLEIYTGKELSLADFEEELEGVAYRPQSDLKTVGRYQRHKTGVEFIKRSFTYWDSSEPTQRLHVHFENNRVSEILDKRMGTVVAGFRLEPQLIGKIYPEHNEDRALVAYTDVPPFLIETLVSVEDRNFFSHKGLDFRGIIRAAFTNLKQGRISQGGSTLTQQLVKNFYLSHERTLWRKFNEVIMALLMERRYSKTEILSAYINEIFLGQHGARAIHGFGTAAEYYFAKPLQELRHDQIALLVGLVKGASYYNPRRNAERALQRRNLVLGIMQKGDQARQTRLQDSQSRPMDLADKPLWSRAKYPAFLDMVKRQLLRDYKIEDLRTEGLHIFTTLDPGLQDKIERVSQVEMKNLEKTKKLEPNTLQLAVVIVHVSSGEIMGMIGGRDRDKVGFNRALDAKRAVGSLLKPIVYYTALSKPSEFNILTIIDDSPISISQKDGSQWQPRNYDRQSHQGVTLIEAMTNSYNQATVRLGIELGLTDIIENIHRLGIKGEIKPYPSLLLGAIEMDPMQVAQIYQSFANAGFYIPHNSIRDVLANDGTPINRYPLQMDQVLRPGPVFLSNFLMTQVVATGTAKSLSQILPETVPLAGKTGTTNDMRDSWFAGFGEETLGVVWLGRDDNKSTKLTGASGALKVWGSMMAALKIKPVSLQAPENIDWLSVRDQNCLAFESAPYIRANKPNQFECE
jgi:penicillin-binding protein 1B